MAPEPLDTEETRRLLSTISSLDDLCILFVNKPQIIVVGDQGSGKSSVLEAISRIHFPVGDGICTRFPIELVLRRAPRESTYLEVLFDTKSLDVGGRSFSRTTRTREPFIHVGFSRDELPALITRAKEHMGLEDGKATGFSRDILLIEMEGPDLPSVTLVDLPGVIHPGFSSQLQDWKPVVDDLVDSYMRRPNSIILTVVSADVPLSAHAVLNKAARFDPDGDRTIGVITKPDLCPSTNIEDQYIKLAKGQESNHHLPLGWHVLRNRGSKEPAMDYDERDLAEDDFLAEGTRKWWRLPLDKVGVDGLRRNLAEVLLNHLRSRLPDLIGEVETEIAIGQTRLKRIGASRANINEMRDYLLGISATFHRLAEHAVEGRYNDPFFASPTVQETSRIKFRKLRALLRNLNRAFHLTMKRKGARYKIQWEHEQQDNGVGAEEQISNYMADAESPEYLQPYLDLYDFPDPTPKSEATVNTRIERIASGSQGVEFPGVPNSDLIMQLFRDLSEPWTRIALRHIDIVVERTRLFVYHLFDYILEDDTKTRDAILAEYVDPVFETTIETLKSKLTEIMRPYTSGHGLPLDLEFRTGLSKRKLARIATQIADLLEQNQSSFTYNTTSYRFIKYEDVRNIVMDANGMTLSSDFGADVVIDMMLTHYEASLKTFTDNVIHLVIENCLVSNLPDIFSTKIVTQMSDDTLRQVAEESPKVREERTKLEDEIEKLRLGLQECQRSRPRNFSEPADNFPELTSPTRATIAPENPNPFPHRDIKKPKYRVRLPPFTEYARTTTSSESPFGQVASTGVSFATLLKKEPDLSFSLKGKAPVFGANVNEETEVPEDDEKATRVKFEPSIFGLSKDTEPSKTIPGPATSLFGAKSPAVKRSLFGSEAKITTTPATTTPVTAFGSVPTSSSSSAQNTGSTTATATEALKPVFGSQNPPKAAADSSGSDSTAANTTTTAKPVFSSPDPPKATVGSTSNSTASPAPVAAFGSVLLAKNAAQVPSLGGDKAPAAAFGSVPVAKPSLFGAAATTTQAQAPKSSLFGSGATTTSSQAPAPKSSFFSSGATTAPKSSFFSSGATTSTSQAPAPKSSFFSSGATTSTSQAPAPTSLFGSGAATTTSQASTPKPSLFGSTTTTSQAPAPMPSIFGAGAAATSSQSTAPKPSLFGGTTSSQSPAPKTSLFAGASTSQAPAPKPSLFGTTTTSTATATTATATAAKTATTPAATSDSSNSTPSKTPSTDGVVGSPTAPPPQSSLPGTEKSSSSSNANT
ncbi:uncharacterized protein TrAtP1_002415 [Trichoderma atroviride]|uniref:uncharacterized protein n=1 Tax=Hypocrea atroviridis TaxID=63577 RepID=UPI003329B40A|nr:hypothetical protein TrAtP1_002415 [Trichoderma atroviride]